VVRARWYHERSIATFVVFLLPLLSRPDGASAAAWSRAATGGLDGEYKVSNTVDAMAVYRSRLYVTIGGARVMAYDGKRWKQVNKPGFGDSNNSSIRSLAVFKARLYAGVTNMVAGAQVWRFDGVTWVKVSDGGMGDADNVDVSAMAVSGGALYACTANVTQGPVVWKYDGAAWTAVSAGGFGDPGNRIITEMLVDGSYLYAATQNLSGCQLWRHDGTSWTKAAKDGFGDPTNAGVNSMAVYKGALYVGTIRTMGAGGIGWQVWRQDGGRWTKLIDHLGSGGADSMMTFGRCLYVGVYNDAAGCELWQYDGNQWTRAADYGFGFYTNIYIPCMAIYQSRLYAGATNLIRGCSVWASSCRGSTPFQDWRKINAEDGYSSNHNSAVSAMALLGSDLYAGTFNADTGCELWRHAGGSWERAVANGFGPDSDNVGVMSMTSFDSRIYIGTQRTEPSSGLWRFDGTEIEAVNTDGFGHLYNIDTTCSAVHGSKLYVGTDNNPAVGGEGGEIFRFDGESFKQVNRSGFGSYMVEVASMASYRGKLYAGTLNYGSGCEVWAYDGQQWSRVNAKGFGHILNSAASSMTVFQGDLYVGTTALRGCEVWRYDGSSWRMVAEGGFGNQYNVVVTCMAMHGGKLWAGTEKEIEADATGGEVWSYDGTRWTKENDNGFGVSGNLAISSMISDGGLLYVGTYNPITGCEVWTTTGE